MRRRRISWTERCIGWVAAFFDRRDPHHRVCRLCHKPIKRREHWRQVRVGWFAPVYTVEHRDCRNPTVDPWQEVAKQLGPTLPFDDTSLG